MRSKNNKERQMDMRPKQRSAYRRGEKILIFVKRGIIILSIAVLIVIVVVGAKLSARPFLIRNVLVSGNHNVEEYEIKKAAVRDSENLLMVSFDELETRIKNIAWVKKVSLRKQFPDTLVVNVEETTPKALLKFNGRLFLVSSDGGLLEEIREKGAYFLPLIVEIDPVKDRGGISEALKLVDALIEKNIVSGRESVEIKIEPYGLALAMDGELLKIGYGEYRDKIVRWKELETEIRKKNINVAYIDLRFKDKVIVKPLNPVEKKQTANIKSKKDLSSPKVKKHNG